MNELIAQIVATANSIATKLSEKIITATTGVSETVLQAIRNALSRIDNNLK